MGKVITSTVKRFPGEVVLSDPLTYPQVIAWERGNKAARAIDRDSVEAEAEMWSAWLPAVCACVEEWRLENMGQLTPETFPASPRGASAELIALLVGEITKLTVGEDDPNE